MSNAVAVGVAVIICREERYWSAGAKVPTAKGPGQYQVVALSSVRPLKIAHAVKCWRRQGFYLGTSSNAIWLPMTFSHLRKALRHPMGFGEARRRSGSREP